MARVTINRNHRAITPKTRNCINKKTIIDTEEKMTSIIKIVNVVSGYIPGIIDLIKTNVSHQYEKCKQKRIEKNKQLCAAYDKHAAEREAKFKFYHAKVMEYMNAYNSDHPNKPCTIYEAADKMLPGEHYNFWAKRYNYRTNMRGLL